MKRLTATLTEKGKITAEVLRRQREMSLEENYGEIIETPWYAMYMDSYYEQQCERAKAIRAEMELAKAE